MNTLLIVGNGFDLANGLPTSYINFLDYMKKTKAYFDNCSEDQDTLRQMGLGLKKYTSYDILCKMAEECGKLSDFIAMKVACSSYRDNLLDFFCTRKIEREIIPSDNEFFQYLQENKNFAEYNICMLNVLSYGNLWLDYFEDNLRTNARQNWIDLEGDISRVVQYIEKIIIEHKRISNVSNNFIIPSISDFMNPIQVKREYYDYNFLYSYIAILLSEMKILVGCLELYMFLMGKIPSTLIDKQPDIEKIFCVDWLLNFNYTSTFQRYYFNGYHLKDNDEDVDYIHGKAGLKNIIIGVQDTLDKQHQDVILDCVNFKKYFQRVFFKTGIKYRQWLPNEKQENNDVFVYIFGHSLDETDGEVFRYIICNPNVKMTIIYYHNDESYQAKILNLIAIIGKDELIRRTGTGNIVFLHQME